MDMVTGDLTPLSDGSTIEIAYRMYGEPFRRKTFKSEAACEAWIEKHEDDLAEIRLPY
jgi:hypothetical protein